MLFRIYYGDGSTYEGAPELAPRDNVQIITQPDPRAGYEHVRMMLKSWDIYIFSDGIGWHATDKYADLMEHLKNGIGPDGVRAVLTGRWIPRAEFDAIEAIAKNEGDLRVVDA